ncbi:glyoxalase/bleomycin resistance/extradiol dioxygenase family protein [Aquimarina sp. MMG016]|uniref:glyoxalase/bleomycin resistance/extradiol dioxygenase family protein n=1 Tax=Aquimarina sp. MMG016 TaxID=2822690 RepID=UPI001B3A51AA|nr:glyoxalase/bleomycin resistance/extradiol dioxygenase family protein [Aquimarina sp. MMG016]MBQ4822438.1 glyoxalase/bleomycin resistance/extradiol dioxygenase family protein [Aquimarina sp. MMG016]
MSVTLPTVVPVLPSANIKRDLDWYKEKAGFELLFKDGDMYVGIRRDNITLHLQWHADTKDDPLLGGSSVVKIFVKDVQPIFDEFVERGTVPNDKLRRNTPWGTHEFGFYDMNNNAIFFVQDV